MSELLKSSAGGAAVGKPVAPCCDTGNGNGKTAGAELAGIKGAAAAAAPACDGAVGGETTRELHTCAAVLYPRWPRVCLFRGRVEVGLRLPCSVSWDFFVASARSSNNSKFHN